MKLGSFFHGPQLWRFIKRNVISKQKIPSCSPMVPHLYRGSWPLCSCFGGPKQLCLCLGLAFHIWIFHYFLALLLYKNKQTKNCWLCYTGLALNRVCCMHCSSVLTPAAFRRLVVGECPPYFSTALSCFRTL